MMLAWHLRDGFYGDFVNGPLRDRSLAGILPSRAIARTQVAYGPTPVGPSLCGWLPGGSAPGASAVGASLDEISDPLVAGSGGGGAAAYSLPAFFGGGLPLVGAAVWRRASVRPARSRERAVTSATLVSHL